MRTLNKSAIHTKAVELGRASKNGMAPTANRLATVNVDKVIDSIVDSLKASAWSQTDDALIMACASRLWLHWCMAEIRTKIE